MAVSLSPILFKSSAVMYRWSDSVIRQALKLRRRLSKQIDRLKADNASGTDIAQFDAIDDTLTQ